MSSKFSTALNSKARKSAINRAKNQPPINKIKGSKMAKASARGALRSQPLDQFQSVQDAFLKGREQEKKEHTRLVDKAYRQAELLETHGQTDPVKIAETGDIINDLINGINIELASIKALNNEQFQDPSFNPFWELPKTLRSLKLVGHSDNKRRALAKAVKDASRAIAEMGFFREEDPNQRVLNLSSILSKQADRISKKAKRVLRHDRRSEAIERERESQPDLDMFEDTGRIPFLLDDEDDDLLPFDQLSPEAQMQMMDADDVMADDIVGSGIGSKLVEKIATSFGKAIRDRLKARLAKARKGAGISMKQAKSRAADRVRQKAKEPLYTESSYNIAINSGGKAVKGFQAKKAKKMPTGGRTRKLPSRGRMGRPDNPLLGVSSGSGVIETGGGLLRSAGASKRKAPKGAKSRISLINALAKQIQRKTGASWQSAIKLAGKMYRKSS